MSELIPMQRFTDAATACRDCSAVYSTTVVDDATTGRALLLALTTERVPPNILQRLSEFDLGIEHVQPQGDVLHVRCV